MLRYVCIDASGVDAQGRGLGSLVRQTLTLPLAASAACPSTASGAAVLASGVSACSFDYSGSDLKRNALLSMTIAVTDRGETVSLQHEVHVSNVP